MKRLGFFCLLLVTALLFLASPWAVAGENVFDLPVLHPSIPLLDENGDHVMNSNKPYSSRMSCGNGEGGGCHDIDKISKAYHFEMGRDEADDSYGKKIWLSELGLTSEKMALTPHNASLLSPGYFGGFNCGYNPGQVNNPQWLSKKTNKSEGEFLDYGAAGLVKNCAECHNGGGFAEKDRNNRRYDQVSGTEINALDGDYFEWLKGDGSNASGTVLSKWNWQKSGVIEPDCMICHTDFTKLTKPSTEWAEVRTKQWINNGFFRFANSAIFAYLNVAPNTPKGKTLLTLPGGMDNAGQPLLKWDASAFDSNGKIQIPMLRFPGNDNCMVCHKTSHDRRGFYGFGELSLTKQDADGVLHEEYPNDIHKGKLWPTKGASSRYIENCNSCHSKQYYKDTFRNVDLDADHNFLVGNSDEDVRKDLNYQPGALSCEYCHNGVKSGGAKDPALPSGFDDIVVAHRELWIQRNDMIGVPNASLNRVAEVHIDKVACQTCHIIRLKYADKDLGIRYRYRQAEDGRMKSMPYKPSTRHYWKDKVTDRVVSRQEYLSVSKGSDEVPQTYGDFIAIKTALDALLKTKGYAKADVQMIWTESNEYLLSHNSRKAISAMPCDDCHTRQPNGRVNSPLADDLIYGKNNVRVVSKITDATAYERLVKEGVVRLEMPYFEISKDGAIVENISDVLFSTEVDPFTSVLRLTAKEFTSGEFRESSKSEALTAAGLDAQADTTIFTAVSSKLGAKVYLFNNKIAGKTVNKMAVMLDYTNASKNIVPNYRLEVALSDWSNYSLTPPATKIKKLSAVVKQGAVKSYVFNFILQNQQKQGVETLGASKLVLKLPYSGISKVTQKVGLFETRLINDIQLAPLSALNAEVLAVKPGTVTNPGFVIALLDRLPERIVVLDLKKAKK